MRSVLVAAACALLCSTAFSQNEETPVEFPKYKLSFTYGLTTRNSENNNIDFHITDDDGQLLRSSSFNPKGEVVSPMREILITFTMRPLNDNKLLILRGGLLQTKYNFHYIAYETSGNSTPTGTLTNTFTEKYAIYPFSIGGGYSTPIPYIQFHAEAIFALGYVTEENVLTMSDNKKIFNTRTYHAETIGFRVGVQLNPQLSSFFGLHIEGGYRVLGFYQFMDDVTDKSIPLDFSMTGGFFNGGFTVAL